MDYWRSDTIIKNIPSLYASMKIIGIIPARYASTRFPAKALVNIGNKSMIQRVYEQACKSKSLSKVMVATDHELIFNHVQSFGGEVVMTSEHHPSGTDRCWEAYLVSSENTETKRHDTANYIINIQGDEPFIHPEQIDLLAGVLDGQTEIATLVQVIDNEDTLFNPNTPKVVLSTNSDALYFSRQTIPYLRGIAPQDWLRQHTFYKHIGIYAYRSDILAQLTRLAPSTLEKAEALEQLRWLENGYRIKTAITPYESHGIDTPEDLMKISKLLG